MILNGATYTILIVALLSCSSSKTVLSPKRQERKDIDSLLLVRSIPVRISAKSSFFGKDMQSLLEDSLNVKKYKCLDKETAVELYKEKLGAFMGLNNKERMMEVAEKIYKDKNYLDRENEIAQPYLQSLELFPCADTTANCVGIKRQNLPNVKKQKSWEFTYSDTEPINQLISRIIDTLTASKHIR